jgi:hypothetical protein
MSEFYVTIVKEETKFKTTALWDMASCSLLINRRFKLRTDSIIKLRRYSSTRLHGALSQKAAIYILAAMRT